MGDEMPYTASVTSVQIVSRQLEQIMSGMLSPISSSISRLVSTEVPFHVLVVSVARKQSETAIRIEFSEIENGDHYTERLNNRSKNRSLSGTPRTLVFSNRAVSTMRASTTSLVCLLGVGIGLGSYMLYRLWSKVFTPSNAAAARRRTQPRVQSLTCTKKKNNRSRPNTPTSLSDDGSDIIASRNRLCAPTTNMAGTEQVLPDSPDSGCMTMGNTDSSNPNSSTVTPTTPVQHTTYNHSALDNQQPRKRHINNNGKGSNYNDNDYEECEHGSYIVIDKSPPESGHNSSSSSVDTVYDTSTDMLQQEKQHEQSSFDHIELSSSSQSSSSHVQSMQGATKGNQSLLKRQQHLDSSQSSQEDIGGGSGGVGKQGSELDVAPAMQGSMFSSASTDLGFVSGNYSSDNAYRENSQEPAMLSLGSYQPPSFQLDLEATTKKKERTKNSAISFKEIDSPNRANYSMSEFEKYPTHLSSSCASYSFLNESSIHAVSPTRCQSAGDAIDTATDRNNPRTLSDSVDDHDASASFHIDQPTHSTPQCESDDEIFKAYKKTPMAPTKSRLSQSHHIGGAGGLGGLRRNHSFTSEISTTSDGSYYFYGGHSVDCGDNFSGRSTPDSEAFRETEIGGKTASNINELQSQIQVLRTDLDEMTEHIQNLNSRDNLSYLPEIDGVSDIIRGSRLSSSKRPTHLSRKHHNRSSIDGSSSVHSLNYSEDQNSDSKVISTPNQGDFMWDYQSDLASGVPQNFVASRPVVGGSLTKEELSSRCHSRAASLEHINKYLHEQCQSVSISNDTRNNITHTGDNDMYIDDGYSFQLNGGSKSHLPQSSANDKLCGDCKTECCKNCGKKINSSYNSNNTSGFNSGNSSTTPNKVTISTNTMNTSLDTKSNCTQTDSVNNGKTGVENCDSVTINSCTANSVRIPPIGRAASKSPVPVIQQHPMKTVDTGSCEYVVATAMLSDIHSFISSPPSSSSTTSSSYTSPAKCSNTSSHTSSPRRLVNSVHNTEDRVGNCECMHHSNQQRDCNVHHNHPVLYQNANYTSNNVTPAACHLCSSAVPATSCKSQNPSCVNNHSSNGQQDTTSYCHHVGHLCSEQQRLQHSCGHSDHSSRHSTPSKCALHGKENRASPPLPVSNPQCIHTCGSDEAQMRKLSLECQCCNSNVNTQYICHCEDRITGILHHSAECVVRNPNINKLLYNSQKQEESLDMEIAKAASSSRVVAKKEYHWNDDFEKSEKLKEVISGDVYRTAAVSSASVSKKWEVRNIGERCEIGEYVKKEWKGETEKAVAIRKGYESIPSTLDLCHIRQIRGDNYCALRSSLYQVLTDEDSPLHKHLDSLESTLQKLDMFKVDNYGYLKRWNFANRVPYNKDDVYSTLRQCVRCLYKQMEICKSKESCQERREYLLNVLNSNPDTDLQILEAIKCLMMINAIQYYEKNLAGEDVPVFVWLLFARDTSDTPESFLVNHMNSLGDSGGMEQIEMFLLGYTLGVKLTVVRPYLHGKEDFITHFPDDQTFPEVILIAEDDRHYNVLEA